MNVRLMEEKDVPFVAALLAYCENQSTPRGTYQQGHLDMATRFVGDTPNGFALVIGDTPVGCVLAMPIDDDAASVGFLTVLSQLRAQRLSLALIDAVVMMLTTKGYSSISIIRAESGHWHKFYDRLGFKRWFKSEYRARMDDVIKGLLSVEKENSLWLPCSVR